MTDITANFSGAILCTRLVPQAATPYEKGQRTMLGAASDVKLSLKIGW